MKHLLLTLCFASFFLSGIAQERIVSGTLRDETGSPLPGVNILLKGTTKGTTTDAEGRYSIKVPLGSTLIFSFIGFATQEMRVTEGNSDPIDAKKNQPQPAISQKNTLKPSTSKFNQNKRGIAILDDNAPGYQNLNNKSPDIRVGFGQINRIRYLSPKQAYQKYGNAGRNGMYVLHSQNYSFQPSAWQINFNTAITLDVVNKLPQLQSAFAQGRPVNNQETWQSAESQEIFSWGPKISNLEFDGSVFDYDKNGRLVAKGYGNGVSAHVYNPYHFFQKGITTSQSVSVSKTIKAFYFNTSISSQQQQSVIPGQSSQRETAFFKIKSSNSSKIKTNFSVNYVASRSYLPVQGSGLMYLMASVFTTPTTFDNANGLSAKNALHNSSSYLLNGGNVRNFAFGKAANPFGLANRMPDHEKSKKAIAYLNTDWYSQHFSLKNNIGADWQSLEYVYGLPVLSAGFLEGRQTNRINNNLDFNDDFSVSYEKNNADNLNFKINAIYNLLFQNRKLDRKDYKGSDIWQNIVFSGNRLVQEPKITVNFVYDNTLTLTAGNQGYFSSTLPSGKFFLPHLGLAFSSERIIQDDFSAKLRSSFSKNIQEAPLLYRKWNYNATSLPVSQYTSYFENQELIFTQGISPERITKMDAGLELNLFRNKMTLIADLYHNTTTDALVPVWNGNSFTLQNAATLLTKGFEATFMYYTGNYNNLHWNVALNFSRIRPEVKSLVNGANRLPVAGFADASLNLVPGQPYGLIYGTTFLRNEAGQKIIGTDGFPLVNQTPQAIGNPNPDWTAGLTNTFSWKNLEWSFVCDFRKGGVIWNGTHQALSYLGLSKNTETERNIRNYIYEGVKTDGSVNGTPVDFANPANGLSGNRWVKYGIAGVGEEAIEKGGWIRLNELKLTYNFKKLPYLSSQSRLSVSFLAKNLLLITPYSGTDPANTLWGYDAANGLDFFNAPATRSYGFLLNFKI
jgi:hypothetical protein